jgi:hypothetical protein
MKTAIAIDSLLSRDESVFILEMVLNLFPNSEIYTIAHTRGAILGPVETRPIVSSFLTHKTKQVSDLKKSFWILPSAVKAIPLHPSIEKVIVISRGYIHGLKLPENVEKFLYILDWNLVEQNNLGWQKFFGHYVNNWREQSLIGFTKVAVSSSALKHQLALPNADVLEPTFKTEDYNFVKDEDHNFVFTHHLVYTQGLANDDFTRVVEFLISKGEMVRVLGPDEHLRPLLKENEKLEFGGSHCEATNAVYSHQAKAIWDFSLSFFPSRAFGALCTGRPVVVRENPINRELLTNGAYFINNLSDIEKIYNDLEENYLQVDRRSLRRLGLKWNERLFKSRMAKFLNKNS